jgi:hypothetical protein
METIGDNVIPLVQPGSDQVYLCGECGSLEFWLCCDNVVECSVCHTPAKDLRVTLRDA